MSSMSLFLRRTVDSSLCFLVLSLLPLLRRLEVGRWDRRATLASQQLHGVDVDHGLTILGLFDRAERTLAVSRLCTRPASASGHHDSPLLVPAQEHARCAGTVPESVQVRVRRRIPHQASKLLRLRRRRERHDGQLDRDDVRAIVTRACAIQMK